MYQVRNGREIGEDAWPVQQSPTRIAGTRVLLGGSVGYDGGGAAVKRKSVGTGVFLPRRYGNNNDIDAYSDPRKRPGILQFTASATFHFPILFLFGNMLYLIFIICLVYSS